MEPSSPPSRKGRSTVLFALVAFALLLVGIGAGYVLGRPAAPAPLGPVNSLARASAIPRVDGWFRNASVSYLDFGPQSNVAVPILAFFQATSPSTPVAGQRNIIDTIPSQPGYSDFWRVYKVLVPDGYVANSIRSLGEAVASGYTIQETNTIVNCPVVNPNASIAGSSPSLVSGWYRNRDVFYFDEGTRSPAEGPVVVAAPIYAFFHSDGTAVAGQRNVIDALPGNANYSDLWTAVTVVVDVSYGAHEWTGARWI